MAKQITIPGFIHASMPRDWEYGNADIVDGVKYAFWTHEKMGTDHTMVCPYEMTFTLPAQYDPTAGFVASLEAEKKRLMADHQNEITKINSKIQQLLAITCEAA